MLDVALKLLKELTSKSYKAYIVGGFVRDHLLGIESSDIDITTNATPKDIKSIFKDSFLPSEDYGSVTVMKKGIRFEITTFRKEIEYKDNRKPIEIEYIDDLYSDLLRRDFTINTLCMDKDGNIIDYLGGREDIENKIIRTVGDASSKFNEDSLRILRAIRFATILGFSLSNDVIEGIKSNKYLIRNLSYYRKRSELDKIFVSPNRDVGIKMLLDLGLDTELELPNLKKVLGSNTKCLIGIWSILNVTDKYPFNKNELELIRSINNVMEYNNMDPYTLYKYGLYVNSVVAEIKGLDIKDVTEAYVSLVIKSKKDIDVSTNDILYILNRKPGVFLKTIYDDIEREILYRRLENKKDIICDYVHKKYE